MNLSRVRTELPLIFAAVFIAFVIWLIGELGAMGSTWVRVSLRLENIPANMEVDLANEVNEVSLNVQFPQEQRTQIVDKNFMVVIDASEVFSGEPAQWPNPTEVKTYDYALGYENVVIRNLPASVHVIRIEPPIVELEGRLHALQADVDVQLEGELPERWELTAPPVPQPAKVWVSGPPEALEQVGDGVNKIPTEPINLSNLTSSRQIERNLILPEQVRPVQPLDGTITVNIGLVEKTVERTISEIPVQWAIFDPQLDVSLNPAEVDVLVSGPTSALEQLDAGDIEFLPARDPQEVPGKPQQVALEARLKPQVSATLARQVTILEVRPPRITVEFMQREGQDTEDSVAP